MKLVTGIAILGWEYSAEIQSRAILYSVLYAAELQRNADTAGNGNSCHSLQASYEGALGK